MGELKIKRTSGDWVEIIQRCMGSSLRVKDWCKINEVSIRSYYYWYKKLITERKKDLSKDIKESIESRPSFVELKYPKQQKSNKESPIYIYKEDLQIEITHEATKEEMAEILSALIKIC